MGKRKLAQDDPNQKSLHQWSGFTYTGSKHPSGLSGGAASGHASPKKPQPPGTPTSKRTKTNPAPTRQPQTPSKRNKQPDLANPVPGMGPASALLAPAAGEEPPPADPGHFVPPPVWVDHRQAAQQRLKDFDLNEQQTSAVHAAYNRPVSILAGAGTGKTTTVVARVLRMVASGIPPCASSFPL